MSEKRHNTQNNHCDLLAAYELGLLEDDECRGFENHLIDCAECAEELFAMAPAAAAMTAKPGAFARKAADNLQAESFFARLNRFLFSGPARALVPVAAVAVLAMLIFMPQAPDPKFGNLATTEAPTFFPIQVRAGGDNQWLPLWESGMQHYQDGNYEDAAHDLNQAVNLLALNPDPDSEHYTVLDNAQVYLGVSHLLSDQEEKAVATLKVAAQSQMKPVQQKALWYLAQAYLVGEQPEDALAVLEQLQNSPVFKVHAANLMVKINNLVDE